MCAGAARLFDQSLQKTGRCWHPDFEARLGRILIPLTFIVGAYHGLLLAVLGSHPLWNTGPTVIAALLAFGLYSMLRGESKHRRTQIYSITVSSLLIVVGAFFFRLALILGGQSPVPVNLTF